MQIVNEFSLIPLIIIFFVYFMLLINLCTFDINTQKNILYQNIKLYDDRKEEIMI